MSPKELTAFRIAPEVMAGLRAVKERDLIPISVQVDQALRKWLESRGVSTKTKAGRKRATTRKRP